MQIYWSEFAFDSLIEIIAWYKIEAGDEVAKAVKKRINKQISIYNEPPLNPNSLGTSEKLPFCATVILKSGRKFQYLAIFSSKQPVFLENKPFFRLIFKFQTQSGVDVHKHPLE